MVECPEVNPLKIARSAANSFNACGVIDHSTAVGAQPYNIIRRAAESCFLGVAAP